MKTKGSYHRKTKIHRNFYKQKYEGYMPRDVFIQLVVAHRSWLHLLLFQEYTFLAGQIARQLIQCGRLGQFRLASRLLYSG
jgi:hypothetical protein